MLERKIDHALRGFGCEPLPPFRSAEHVADQPSVSADVEINDAEESSVVGVLDHEQERTLAAFRVREPAGHQNLGGRDARVRLETHPANGVLVVRIAMVDELRVRDTRKTQHEPLRAEWSGLEACAEGGIAASKLSLQFWRHV